MAKANQVSIPYLDPSVQHVGISRLRALNVTHGGADGVYPYGGLLRDAAGNLYGTTEFGGSSTTESFSRSVRPARRLHWRDRRRGRALVLKFVHGRKGQPLQRRVARRNFR